MRGDICVQLKATLDLKLTFILDGYTDHITTVEWSLTIVLAFILSCAELTFKPLKIT
jgi:hypothetical protein